MVNKLSRLVVGIPRHQGPRAQGVLRPPTSANPGTLASQIGIYSWNPEITGPHTWALPTALRSGDRILVSVHVYSVTETIDSMPSGYTEVENTLLPNDGGGGSAGRFYVFEKDSDGTETDGEFTLTGGAKVVLISKRIAGNGNTLGTSEIAASGVESLDPPPITPSDPGLYAVTIYIVASDGSPDPDNETATPSGYEFQAYRASEAATARPRIYMAQRAVEIATNEDPGAVGWSATTGGFGSIIHAFTVATRLDTGSPDLATGDHTHVEADISDLDHWTEADHDALDHTGLPGVGGGGGGVEVKKAGTTIGTRSAINFIEGTDITLTIADDAGNDEVDVTVTSTASGGGGSSTVPEWMERLAAPASPHGDNEEFDGAISGTAVTPTGTVAWEVDGGLLTAAFEDQSTGDHCPRLWPLTPSASPVTIETRGRMHARQVSNPMFGLMFAEEATTLDAATAAVSFGIYATTGTPTLARWAGTLTSMTTSNLSTNMTYGVYDSWVYLRLIWVSSNTFAWAISPSGVDGSWTDYSLSTFAATLTPNYFGVWVSSWAHTDRLTASFEDVRVIEADLKVA